MKDGFQHIDLSKLRFIERVCDLCKEKERVPVCSVYFLGIKFYFVRCASCGLVYQNPALDKEGLNQIYETLEYWNHKKSRDSTMLNYYSYLEEKTLRINTAKIRMQWIEPYLPAKARILDLGCSDGLFVNVLSDFGYNAIGIDVSDAMVSYGRQTYGVNILRMDFENEWPFTESFDAITCYATLSNIVNPSKVFANIKNHLRPGGFFFFNFGDCNRFISRLQGSRLYLYRPTANTIYTRKTIMNYCSKYKLKILNMFNDIQVVPLARLLGFLRIPGLIPGVRFSKLENLSFRMVLFTGYSCCAIRLD